MTHGQFVKALENARVPTTGAKAAVKHLRESGKAVVKNKLYALAESSEGEEGQGQVSENPKPDPT